METNIMHKNKSVMGKKQPKDQKTPLVDDPEKKKKNKKKKKSLKAAEKSSEPVYKEEEEPEEVDDEDVDSDEEDEGEEIDPDEEDEDVESDDQLFVAALEDWQEAVDDLSFDDIRQLVDDAVKDKYKEAKTSNSYSQCPYFIYKIWPDKVVLKRSYGMDDEEYPDMFILHTFEINKEDDDPNPDAILDDGKAVNAVFVPVGEEPNEALAVMREADAASIDDPVYVERVMGATADKEGKHAKNDEGHVAEAKIHEAINGGEFKDSFECSLVEAKLIPKDLVIRNMAVLSETSKNGRTYPVEVMRKAVPLFEGIKAYMDHVDEQKETSRSVRELIGQHKNVRFDEKARKIRSDLHLVPTALVKDYILPIAEHNPELIGNSISAAGRVNQKGIVEELTRARSIDLVDSPATTSGLYESDKNPGNKKETTSVGKEENMDLKTILANEEIMTQLREHIREELEIEEGVGGLSEENESLKEEIAALKAEKAVEEKQKSISEALAASKLPEDVKGDVRPLLEEAKDADHRKTIISRFEKIVEDAKAKAKPAAPSVHFERTATGDTKLTESQVVAAAARAFRARS